MKRILIIIALLLPIVASAQRRTPLTRALADALYCPLATCATASSTTTFTNKSIALGTNTVTGTTAQFNAALTDNDFATLGGIETFTNKSIALSANTVTGTLAEFNTAITDGDLVPLDGALGTPTSGVATNLTGTAAGLTAGTVTTNANLTGPITSTGNATAVASQTGTGSKFVMDTQPQFVTSIGIGVAAPAAPALLTAQTATAGAAAISVKSTDAAGTATSAQLAAVNSGNDTGYLATWGIGTTISLFGVTLARYSTLLHDEGSGLIVGTQDADPLILGTAGIAGLQIGTTQIVGVKAGGSTTLVEVGGALAFTTTTTGNVTTGEDDLWSPAAFPAAMWNVDGQGMSTIAGGSFAATVNTKQIRARLIEGANNTVIFDSGALSVTGGGEWSLMCDVLRATSTTFKSVCRMTTTGAALAAYTDYATGTFTFANSGSFKITGEATATNDVVLELGRAEWKAAP